MFTCQQGHTEGKIKTTLVLVSMDNLYFVEPLQAKNKFSKQAVISYKNIDFVSVCEVFVIQLYIKFHIVRLCWSGIDFFVS
jgi:GTP cyclohydrolase I